MQYLMYLFWPNPGNAQYTSRSMLILSAISALLIVGWFVLRLWRRRIENPITRKLSQTWPVTALSFGLVGLFLVVCRVEGIQFLAMRFLWVLWALGILVYVFFQVRFWRARHYEVIPSVKVVDPKDKYLPQRKK